MIVKVAAFLYKYGSFNYFFADFFYENMVIDMKRILRG